MSELCECEFGRRFEKVYNEVGLLTVGQIPEPYASFPLGVEGKLEWFLGTRHEPHQRYCSCWDCTHQEEFAVDRSALLREAYWIHRCANWLLLHIKPSKRAGLPTVLGACELYSSGVEPISLGGLYTAARVAGFQIAAHDVRRNEVRIFWTSQSWAKTLPAGIGRKI